MDTVDMAISRWRELLRDDPVANDPDELAGRIEAAGLMEDERPLCGVLRPRLVTAARHEEERRLAATVVDALRTMLRAVESGAVPDDGLVGLRDWAARVGSLDPRPSATLPAWLRLDASLARSQLHVVELNADMPIGEGHNDSVVELLEGLETTRRMCAEAGGRLLRLLPAMDRVIERAAVAAGARREAAVAWVVWDEHPERREMVASMVEHAERQGRRVLFADPRELHVGPRGAEVDGVGVGVILRLCSTPECLERPEDAAGLVAAAQSEHTVMLNPLGTEPLGHKALFAAITDPALTRGVLTSAQHRVVARHVPWTRALRDTRTVGPHDEEVDLLDWIVDHRERLVLKPAHGLGGRGVTLGWRSTAAEWEAAVRAGVGEDVVQSRVTLQHERYPVIAPGLPEAPFYEDTDPFLFGGEPGGVLTRLSASEITNVAAGGGITATMLLDGA